MIHAHVEAGKNTKTVMALWLDKPIVAIFRRAAWVGKQVGVVDVHLAKCVQALDAVFVRDVDLADIASDIRRITASCWKSFSPNTAASAPERLKSFSTTVQTPSK